MQETPAVSGPAVYLSDRMTAQARQDYARQLRELSAELTRIDIPNDKARQNTLACIGGALEDIAKLA